MWLEGQIKKLPEEEKLQRKEHSQRYIGTKRPKQNQKRLTIQLEEINQKILATDGRLKRCRDKFKQYKQNREAKKILLTNYLRMLKQKLTTGCKGNKTIFE